MMRTAPPAAVEPDGAPGKSRLQLSAPWPNPTRGAVSLEYILPHAGLARITVRDVAGRQVARVASAFQTAGRHLAVWDGRGAGSRAVAPGVYYISLSHAGEVQTRKVLKLR